MAKLKTEKPGKSQVPYVSIVIPLLNEEESLRELFSQIGETMQRINKYYEVIFVDDGSIDNSFKVLALLHTEHPENIKVIRFRRNFGKSAALSAGFKRSKG
jgi:glycosyltransferase involved in cell wall biosynthesis